MLATLDASLRVTVRVHAAWGDDDKAFDRSVGEAF
jgi:hypothetical protein